METIAIEDYPKFVRALIKPGSKMIEEVTFDQFFFIDSILSLKTIISSFEESNYPDEGPTERNLEYQHMIVGAFGEIGEILDVVKNIIIYRKDPSSKKKGEMHQTLAFTLMEEFGDLIFFLTGACGIVGVSFNNIFKQKIEIIIKEWCNIYPSHTFTFEDCIVYNIKKLSKRYETLSYSDKAAQERKDKHEQA